MEEEGKPPPSSPSKKLSRQVVVFFPGSFDRASHFYPRVLNAQIHPLVRSFLSLGNERIAKRYIHLHPEANPEAVTRALGYSARFFNWGGADLFSVTTEKGQKRFVVVETNSCPSGQKSMPMEHEDTEHTGYRLLLEKAFWPLVKSGTFNGQPLPEGRLAVLYDKNVMEASGYAATLADLADEEVFLVPCYADETSPFVRFREDGVMEIKVSGALPKACPEESTGNLSSKTGPPKGGLGTGQGRMEPSRVSSMTQEVSSKLQASLQHQNHNHSQSQHQTGTGTPMAAAAEASPSQLGQVGPGISDERPLPDLAASSSFESAGSEGGKRKAGAENGAASNGTSGGEEEGEGGRGEKSEEGEEEWVAVRAALRYVTQRPWTRIPPLTRTLIFNPVLACLAGGRNKAVGAKAYDLHNAHLAYTGLSILTPETIWDVAKPEIPLWVGRMGGLAVVKVPYANAGQGVWTITHEEELQEFMALEHRYDRFIVQALIGNNSWSSLSTFGRLYHVGTIPSLKGSIYASDLRVMVGSGSDGFFPVAIYARRARLPMSEKLEKGTSSWDMLGTNLSFKNEDGSWGTETDRLLLMDSRDFNRLGVGVDDLIEAYMQTILAVTAIDRLCCKLITPKGKFGLKLFQSLNPDPKLLGELYSPLLLPPMPPPEPPLSVVLTKGKPERGADEKDEEEGKGHMSVKGESEESLADQLVFEMRVAAPPVKRGRF